MMAAPGSSFTPTPLGHGDNLEQAGLTLNQQKCHLECEELKYLDTVISHEGVRSNDSKMKVIAEMKLPKNAREIAKFLGLMSWYQKFIKGYAEMCEPLYELKGQRELNLWGSLKCRQPLRR
ncbi:hypothetical protein TNCV_2508711 [Trichonephila clavipes]|nr:hypothetical protein TNCV_2508711 [Trichonephila clavipes]